MMLKKIMTACLLILMAGSGLFAQQEEKNAKQELINAYQLEFVFLNNELTSLKKRLNTINGEGRKRVNTARAKLQKLEGELITLTSQTDRKTDELRKVEEEAMGVQETDTTINNIVNQGNKRLQTYNFATFSEADLREKKEKFSEGDKLAMELKYIFSKSFEVLKHLSSISVKKEKFFLPDGHKVEGQIVWVGHVAAFGLAGKEEGKIGGADFKGGTLAPAGSGQLRLINNDNKQIAENLIQDKSKVSSLPIYLFENLDEIAMLERGTTLAETIEGGGLIGLVIIGIGIIGIILVCIRLFFLMQLSVHDPKQVIEAQKEVEKGNLDKAKDIVDHIRGAMGRVLASTIVGIKTDPENIEDIIAESILHEQPTVDRFRSIISVFAAVAPLLGLLGTVTGMIATFDIITQFGTGDPKLLSGGISEALITTEFGLIVAIPLLLVGNLLASRGDRIISNLEVKALQFINLYDTKATQKESA